ncbi:hypothetical protein CAOG_002480 [Capsaspora owczarzaki ATCC 30864]|uniref:Uncharacterized protein n=1 Tax=Capsaspora owczarzaki (strain ATCC 30864) TaxID=595528 RepID=A0A0D2WMF2_CAPO3|nr:hypothetical protein CAOG_002480 [Capsaspora owczarzaki ATCC 30864]
MLDYLLAAAVTLAFCVLAAWHVSYSLKSNSKKQASKPSHYATNNYYFGAHNPSKPQGAMTGTENMFIKCEHEERLQTISGLLCFDELLPVQAVFKIFSDASSEHVRLKQRVVSSSLLLHSFEDADNWKVADHIKLVRLPDGTKEADFQRQVQNVIAEPLDKSKPLWQATLFHNVRNGSGSALLLRMHHCVGDGMAANVLLASAAVDAKGVTFAHMMKEAFTKATNASKKSASGDKHDSRNFVHAFVNLQSLGIPFSSTLASLAFWLILRPVKMIGQAFASLRSTYLSLRLLIVDLFLCVVERKTALRREASTRKSVLWSSSLSLDDVKTVKDAFGVTVNDVLVSALTGGLRRQIIQRGETVPSNVFCPIPVTLRKTVADIESIQNNIAGVWHFLPTGIADPVERLAEVHTRLEERKRNKIYIGFTVFNMSFWGFTPRRITSAIVNHFWGKSAAIITNVPGPQTALFLGGHKIREIHIFGLQSCYGGMAISIMTYDGRVSISVVSDANAEPNQICDTKVLDEFALEFEEYLKLAKTMKSDKQKEESQPTQPVAARPAAKKQAAACQ